jgi:ribonuclease P protein component
VTAPRLTFTRRQRLTHARQFDAVYAGKVQRSRGPLAVHGIPNGLEFCRLGLSVGRRVGGAVARNRAKRLVREAFRLEQGALPSGRGRGLDLIVVVRPPASALELEACRTLLCDLVRGLAETWANRVPKEGPGDV